MVGGIYLFLVNGPAVGIRIGGLIEPRPISWFMDYLFTLGILLVFGTTITTGIPIQKIVGRTETVNGPVNPSEWSG